jgi:methionyl-tRNA formyltransferase
MNTTRIIFMGTPAFAVPVLRALHAAAPAQNWSIVTVATPPDRPAGRGKQLSAGPVKVAAQALGLPVLQPVGLRKGPEAAASVEILRALAPDLLVVAAYGLILPAVVLEIPTFGCINVHASLLPAWRGASPITASILAGDTESGVSIMLMDVGMDTGPVLAQVRTPLAPDDTTESLGNRLAEQGAMLLVETLPRWLAGDAAPVPQDDLPGEATLCRMIRKEEGRIDWRLPAAQIERMTRAYSPWPSAWTVWRGAPLRILAAHVLPSVPADALPGQVLRTNAGVAVATGDGLLELVTIQPAGKREMTARAFLNGAPDFVGAVLGAD